MISCSKIFIADDDVQDISNGNTNTISEEGTISEVGNGGKKMKKRKSKNSTDAVSSDIVSDTANRTTDSGNNSNGWVKVRIRAVKENDPTVQGNFTEEKMQRIWY